MYIHGNNYVELLRLRLLVHAVGNAYQFTFCFIVETNVKQ